MQPLIHRVLRELKRRHIFIKLDFIISDEWGCDDYSTTIQIPFYLLNKRLMLLQNHVTNFVGVETKDECLKTLRHEIGHAIDNAYGLSRSRCYTNIFGRGTSPYRNYYIYNPYSKKFVTNIGWGYAQSHPAEDFAETFAVWLDPKSKWISKYAKTPAIKKLLYVKDQMSMLHRCRPSNFYKTKSRGLDQTLKDYYITKLKQLYKLEIINITNTSKKAYR